MNILGIHDGHNSSAALIIDGKIVSAIQEERLTRVKNHGGYPEKSIQEVLKIGRCSLKDIDAVSFNGYIMGDKHNTHEESLLVNHRRFEIPRKNLFQRTEIGLRKLRNQIFPSISKSRKEARREKKRQSRMNSLLCQGFSPEKIHFIDHHFCHAATAYYGQGDMDEKILVLTSDGAGDGLCATVSLGKEGNIERIFEVPRSESVAILYAFVTYLLGFTPLEHEYKLMGMAPYASGAKQSYEISEYFHSLFEFGSNSFGWKRAKNVPPSYEIAPLLRDALRYKRFDSICGGLQKFTEEITVKWVQNVIHETGIRKLALSGGLFMNVKMNKCIMDLPEVDSLFVFPSCGDESNSIGSALATYAKLHKDQGKKIEIPPLDAIYFGGGFSQEEAKRDIELHTFQKKVKVTAFEDIEKKCAELLAQGKVVARCKGRMEFGARALGNRSILANASKWETIHLINSMIKQRDFWMPFAPSMLEEYADHYIHNPKKIKASYMIMAFDSKKEEIDRFLAAIHPYDKSCRPQIVEKTKNPDYHRLISYFYEMTGSGVILNTSFNLHGYPIVYTPAEAIDVFERSGLHYLALENYLIEELLE